MNVASGIHNIKKLVIIDVDNFHCVIKSLSERMWDTFYSHSAYIQIDGNETGTRQHLKKCAREKFDKISNLQVIEAS